MCSMHCISGMKRASTLHPSIASMDDPWTYCPPVAFRFLAVYDNHIHVHVYLSARNCRYDSSEAGDVCHPV